MADYTLSEGQAVLITASTSVDDFVYEGGKITVAPSVPFELNGRFVFRPTASIDPLGMVLGAFVNRLRLECGSNGLLSGFTIYDTYPDRRGVHFPCVVIDEGQATDADTVFFGGDSMIPINISCDLVFKKDSLRMSSVTDEFGNFITLENETMAQHMLFQCDNLFNSIHFESEHILVGELQIGGSVQTPQIPSQTLYGFKMDIYIDFKVVE